MFRKYISICLTQIVESIWHQEHALKFSVSHIHMIREKRNKLENFVTRINFLLIKKMINKQVKRPIFHMRISVWILHRYKFT